MATERELTPLEIQLFRDMTKATPGETLPPLPEFMATSGLDDYALHHAAELGRLRVQVELLRESLERYGRHSSWCLASTEAKRCTCGFEDARRVGL